MDEPFLSRWSRRKLEAKDPPSAVLPAAELPATESGVQSAPAAEPAAPGPAQDRSAEYREYFDPQVDEKLRRAALKNLFSDPHFNVMDGLDTYIDDYSKPDPIPEAMLRRLNQAKELFIFDDETKPDAGASGQTMVAAEPEPALPAMPEDMSMPADPADARISGMDAATGSTATPPLDYARKS